MTPQSKSRPAKAKKEPTFFDFLKQDHDKVRDLFDEIEDDGGNREELFSALQSGIRTHLELEEKFFYPVLEQSDDARDAALESYEEHNVAKTVLGEFGGMNVEDERWDAKLKVLQEIVNHHLQEEEKNIFKMARKVLEPDQIRQITDQIQQRRSEAGKKAA